MPPMESAEPKKTSLGAIVAIVIVLVLIIAGGFYTYKQMQAKKMPADQVPAGLGAEQPLPPTSPLDTVEDISKDLEVVPGDLDAELNAL